MRPKTGYGVTYNKTPASAGLAGERMKSPFRAHNPVRVPDGIQLHTNTQEYEE